MSQQMMKDHICDETFCSHSLRASPLPLTMLSRILTCSDCFSETPRKEHACDNYGKIFFVRNTWNRESSLCLCNSPAIDLFSNSLPKEHF